MRASLKGYKSDFLVSAGVAAAELEHFLSRTSSLCLPFNISKRWQIGFLAWLGDDSPAFVQFRQSDKRKH